MDRFEIVHILIDKLGNRDLRQIAMGFVSDEAHCEDIAESCRYQVRIFCD